MPKMKSKRASGKRFSFTASGQVKFKKAGKRHILSNKSSKRKMRLRSSDLVHPSSAGHVYDTLPYGRSYS